MTLVRFYLNGSAHNSEVSAFLREAFSIFTGTLLDSKKDHFFAMAFTQHTSTIIIKILYITRSELL